MVNKFIIFGPPGVGKGTLATLVAKKYHLSHISTGNIFREEIAKQSELGQKLQAIVESGKYVDDVITNEIVKNKLVELKQNYILDGYPRTEDQLNFLFDLIDYKQFRVWILHASQATIIQRLSGRRYCLTCKSNYHVNTYQSEYCTNDDQLLIQRADDSVQAISKRLEIYQNQTESLIKRLVELNIVTFIDADADADQVLVNLESTQKFD